jgi:branched-chain amino acid transport system permease protein
VLYALSIGSVAPDSFGLTLSIQFLAMIVLGGLGSVAGSILGAIFVSALPLVFQQYAGSLPFIVDPGEPGIVASQAAAFLYGAAIVLVVLFEPGGLVGLARRLRRPSRAPGVSSTSPSGADQHHTTSPAQATPTGGNN